MHLQWPRLVRHTTERATEANTRVAGKHRQTLDLKGNHGWEVGRWDSSQTSPIWEHTYISRASSTYMRCWHMKTQYLGCGRRWRTNAAAHVGCAFTSHCEDGPSHSSILALAAMDAEAGAAATGEQIPSCTHAHSSHMGSSGDAAGKLQQRVDPPSNAACAC